MSCLSLSILDHSPIIYATVSVSKKDVTLLVSLGKEILSTLGILLRPWDFLLSSLSVTSFSRLI
jgi:hypothetical protein